MRLKLQQVIPFIVQQQLNIPPAIIVHRFCSIAAETLSSHAQVTFMPPAQRAKVIVHRGIIIMFIPGAAVGELPIRPVVPVIGMLGIAIPGIAMPDRSIIFAVAILVSSAM